MSLLANVVGGVLGKVLGGVFTKKTTTVDAEGVETESRKARPVAVSLAGVVAALLIYHFLLWPVLNYHFPEYGFPPLDISLLSIFAGLGF